MAEVLDCVSKDAMEKLLNEIISSRIPVPNCRYVYDRNHWNKEIQNLCFGKRYTCLHQIDISYRFGIKVDRGTQLTDSQLHKQCCLLHFAAGNIVYLLELQRVRCHDQVIRLQ